MRRRLAGVMRIIPLSLSTKLWVVVGTVLETFAVLLEGGGFSELEEATTACLSRGAWSKITVVVWGTEVGPLQGGSSSSSLDTEEFGRLKRRGALEALFEESKESTIHEQMAKRGVDREEGVNPRPQSLLSLYSTAPVHGVVTLSIDITCDVLRTPRRAGIHHTARYPAAEDNAGSLQGERGSRSVYPEVEETARVDVQQRGVKSCPPPCGRVHREDPKGV